MQIYHVDKNMVDYSTTILSNFILWISPSCLKVYGGWVVVGPHDFSVSPSPLGTYWVFELG